MSEVAAAAKPRYVSILGGIRPYDRSWLTRDVIAGVTLAALAIPEVMGYTKIAGTPVVTGLYTLVLPVLAFGLLGSSRHLVVGGDSATAAIMYAGIAGLGISGLRPDTPEWVALAGLSALICGGLLLLARVARLGFLADFISRTVLIGFLTGVGIQVSLGQLAGMLGVPSPKVDPGAISGTLIKFWDTLKEVGQTSGATLAVSLSVIAVLVLFERFIPAIPGGLVAVIGAIAVSWAADLESHGVSTLGHVPGGLPHVGFPAGVGLGDAGKLFTVSVSMFLVIVAQSAATSRAYAVRYQERFVENDDLVGLGVANLLAGLSSTFVVNGSPTKTEMVDQAKSRSQVAQLTTAAVIVLVLLFLTKPLEYMPNAVLASVVFVIGLKLVKIVAMRQIWALRRDEFVVAVITAGVVVIVGVEQGIILAILLSIALHVKRHYTPHDAVVSWTAVGTPTLHKPVPGALTEPGLIVYRFPVGIFFANATRLAEDVLGLVTVPDPPRWFVLVADGIDDIDYTGGTTLLEVAEGLEKRGIVLAIAEADADVLRELRRFGVLDHVAPAHIFETADEARAAFDAAGSGR